MESFLRWGLLFIAAFVVFLIFYDIFFRRTGNSVKDLQPLTPTDSVSEPFITSMTDTSQIKEIHENDLIVITVLSKSPHHFASYDLLQAITVTGMQYGEMNIFHYYQATETGKIILFSLASATKPGSFNLDHMGDFSCLGLSLFMNKNKVPEPKKTFLMMLEKAQQLADDLDGELRAGSERKPWSQEIFHRYMNLVSE